MRWWAGWLTACAVIFAAERPFIYELVAGLAAHVAVYIGLTYLKSGRGQ